MTVPLGCWRMLVNQLEGLPPSSASGRAARSSSFWYYTGAEVGIYERP